jgi:SAM-dependent methyltransferase
VSLQDEWERNAPGFVDWVRVPGHDSYWRFHRDQFLDLLPPPGRLTIDIGCGEGRLSRDLKALGHAVVAVDASPTMVAHAREADPELEVHLADAAARPFPDEAADLAVAFMCLQDVDDLPGTVSEAARVLEPGGRLCLAIVHPLNSAGSFSSEPDDSPFVIEGSYLDAFRYADTLEHEGVQVTFASEHRPLQTYADALEAAGLRIERLREPRTSREQTRSGTARWERVPLFLHVRAVK